MKKLINSMKYITLSDILAIFIYILMIIPSLIFKLILKLQNRKIWLICEDGTTARDNGYHFYKYLKENDKKEDSYYVISKKSNDYHKVEKYGNIIKFKSLKHWLYYMSADKNISSQKSGNPNAALFYVLHVWFNLYNNRIFLQHGITYHDSTWLYYKNTKFKTFICGAKKEYDYIKENFGYPESNILYLGFPRFDELNNLSINKKQILIMPTWRNWLGRKTNKLHKKVDFKKTEYFKKWNSLINNNNLIKYIEKHDIEIIFYPHIHMHKYIDYFKTKSNNIKIVTDNYDIQELLKNSALLITDYSSVYMDFAYMSKPIIYYTFDYDEYHKKHLQEGYFKYSKDAFGKILNDEDDLVNKIIGYINMDYKMEKLYKKRIEDFFLLKDCNNCSRIYDEITKI